MYLFKVNNENTRTAYEICSKLTSGQIYIKNVAAFAAQMSAGISKIVAIEACQCKMF